LFEKVDFLWWIYSWQYYRQCFIFWWSWNILPKKKIIKH